MEPLTYAFVAGILLGVFVIASILLAIVFYFGTKEALKVNKQVTDSISTYKKVVESMPKEAIEEMSIKARNTMELAAEAYSLPESHFESLGTTRDAQVKQIYKDYENWLRRNKYPVLGDYIPKA